MNTKESVFARAVSAVLNFVLYNTTLMSVYRSTMESVGERDDDNRESSNDEAQWHYDVCLCVLDVFETMLQQKYRYLKPRSVSGGFDVGESQGSQRSR